MVISSFFRFCGYFSLKLEKHNGDWMGEEEEHSKLLNN